MGTTRERIDGVNIYPTGQHDLAAYQADQKTLQCTLIKKQVASIYRDGTGMPR